MILLILLFLLLTGCILTNSALSLSYASMGLELWFQKMVPALLPFMILSGIMVRLNLTEKIAMSVYPIVGRIYWIRKNVCYCMLLGFLCGFPMGAKVTGELLERGQLTHREAEYLLAFCNNIGPVYFCSFVLPLLERKLIFPYLFGMYGIPLIYGLVLSRSAYRDVSATIYTASVSLHKKNAIVRAGRIPSGAELRAAERGNDRSYGRNLMAYKNHFGAYKKYTANKCYTVNKNHTTNKGRLTFELLLEAVDQSIRSSGQSILTLGGYMVLFNLLNLLPHVLAGHSLPILSPLLEITGGLGMLKGTLPLYSLLTLSFGGLSCIAQTYSCIRGRGLSLSNYIFHKIAITLLNAGFYLGWFLLFPDSFLY